jgi:hypothetical protein
MRDVDQERADYADPEPPLRDGRWARAVIVLMWLGVAALIALNFLLPLILRWS